MGRVGVEIGLTWLLGREGTLSTEGGSTIAGEEWHGGEDVLASKLEGTGSGSVDIEGGKIGLDEEGSIGSKIRGLKVNINESFGGKVSFVVPKNHSSELGNVVIYES